MQRPVQLPQTEIHAVTSVVTGEAFELWVGHPMKGWASADGQPTELLFLLDANLFFGMALEMTRLMHTLFGELPPILVAGIAYPDVDATEQSRLRTGHFTPSADPIFAEAARALAPPGSPVPESIPMGGADDFLALLRNQIEPMVRDRFGLASSRSTLFGTSLGGLFGAHVLRTAPEWVDRIIIGSPSLWWHDEEIFSQIADHDGSTREETAGPDVVVTVGSGEEGPAIPHLNRYRLVTNARRLADECARGSVPCRSVHFEVVEGESHTSVVPSSLTRGLRKLLGP